MSPIKSERFGILPLIFLRLFDVLPFVWELASVYILLVSELLSFKLTILIMAGIHDQLSSEWGSA